MASVAQELDFDADMYVSCVDIPSVYQPWPESSDTLLASASEPVKAPAAVPHSEIPKAVCSPHAVLKKRRLSVEVKGVAAAAEPAPSTTPSIPPSEGLPVSPEQTKEGKIREATRLLTLRWRMPALSVHSIQTSSSVTSVIPGRASGTALSVCGIVHLGLPL